LDDKLQEAKLLSVFFDNKYQALVVSLCYGRDDRSEALSVALRVLCASV
jgi:hypothetical protein